MRIKNLINFMKRIERERSNGFVKVYFSRSVNKNYITYLPSISNDVQRQIMETVFPWLEFKIADSVIVDYNPIGILDGELEAMEAVQVPLLKEFLKSITDEYVFKEMNGMNVEQIEFYCICLSYHGKDLYLFRQHQKTKRLKKGLITRTVCDELRELKSAFLGVDECVDLILFEGTVFVINRAILEHIFQFETVFLQKTKEALQEINDHNIIANMEEFSRDCCHDVRVMKRFTNIMMKNRLPLFLENYKNVPKMVREIGLDIQFDGNGRIVYDNKSKLCGIVNLLSDSYVKTSLGNRVGVAELEGVG